MQAMLLADFYKLSHREQYPQGTEYVYSTWTPRTSRIDGVNKVVVFGIQGFIKEFLIEYFNKNFFSLPKAHVVADYSRVVKNTLGIQSPHTAHIEALHDLGYLPLEIKALPEGSLCAIRVPYMTVRNTNPEFFWLTNFLETILSSYLWVPATSATIARQYRLILDDYTGKTGGDLEFVQFQGHDFSMRGMGSLEAAYRSGAGHLLSFTGTDTIPAIEYLERYYNANVEKELVGTSIPATEHSVMCAYQDDEVSFKRLITEVYPSGFVSIVSDTWDLWDVVGRILPKYKDLIMDRDGKLVIRPDSGDPVKIICGDPEGATEAERKGVVQMLWDTFGGIVNAKGFKQLDSHIGAIYGDSISLARCEAICAGLMANGFASTNVVYGIGSFTYQYNTRDTFGFAMKSTMVQINGQQIPIFKNPKTDDGTKKSQRGAVAVIDGKCVDGLTLNDSLPNDQLKTVFRDGKLLIDDSLAIIRSRL